MLLWEGKNHPWNAAKEGFILPHSWKILRVNQNAILNFPLKGIFKYCKTFSFANQSILFITDRNLSYQTWICFYVRVELRANWEVSQWFAQLLRANGIPFGDHNIKPKPKCKNNDERKVLSYAFTYRKSSKETRGSYSSFEAQNAGLIRKWFILPMEFQVYCGSY